MQFSARFYGRQTTQIMKKTIRFGCFLLALAIFQGCSGGGGGSTPPAQDPTVSTPPEEGEVLGMFLEAKTAGRRDLRLQIIAEFLLGENDGTDPSRWRSSIERVLQRERMPDSYRVTASLMTMMEGRVAGEPLACSLSPTTTGRLVAAIVHSGAEDPHRQEFHTDLLAHVDAVAPGVLDTRSGRDRSLSEAIDVPALIENITDEEYASIGRELKSLFEQGATLTQAKSTVLAQVNNVLGPLLEQFDNAAKTGSVEAIAKFEKAQSVLGTVGRVSDFVFGKLFKGDTAQKIGKTIRKVVDIGSTIARVAGSILTGGVSGILSGDLLGSVMGLFGLGKDDVIEQKLEELQLSIQRLGSLMAATRREMHERFDQLEGRIVHLQRRVEQMFQAMITGFNRLADLLQRGFDGVDELMRKVHADLTAVHVDIKKLYEAVRWFADAEARQTMERELSEYFQHLAGARVDSLENAIASLSQARVVLNRAATSATFVRGAPIQSLRDAVVWLPNGIDREALIRIAGMGVLPDIMPFVGAFPLRPHNFEVFYIMARAYLDTVTTRPELIASRQELNDLVNDLEIQIELAREMIAGLSNMLTGSVDEMMQQAEAAEKEWVELLDAFRDARTLKFSAPSTNTPGPLLLAYLDEDYFDPKSMTSKLPFRADPESFDSVGSWPPAPNSIPSEEFVYEVGDKSATAHYRRKNVGFDHLRLGIALGLIRVVESSRSNTEERLTLYWNTRHPIVKNQDLEKLHDQKITQATVRAPGSGLPSLLVLEVDSGNRGNGRGNRKSSGFAAFYDTIERWTDVYLGELRSAVADAIDPKSPRVLSHLKEFSRAGAVIARSNALNDVVTHAGSLARMIEFELWVNDEYVYAQRSDGVIVASPTGSTAYSLSAGGPIMHPSLDAIVIVPMFPHTLSSRPLVVRGDSVVRIRLNNTQDATAQLSCDSQVNKPLQVADEIVIAKNRSPLRLLYPQGHSFYESCRSKLDWASRLGGR